jgi:hypothetical protein
VSRRGRGLTRFAGLVLGGVVALSTSGCVAAGLAAGPLMTAVQVVSDRTVERTVAAELAEAQGVTEAVLTRMAFRIESRERDDGLRRLRAVAGDVTVHAKLERVTATMTRVGLRVEAGRLVADRDTGAQIHEQISRLLEPASARPAPSDPALTEALTTLQGEVRKLRSDQEERRAAERPAPSASASTSGLRVEPGAIVTAPMSAALPTVGGSAPPVAVAVPATAASTPPPAVPATRRDDGPADLRTAAPLAPAGVLTPIRPGPGVGSSR